MIIGAISDSHDKESVSALSYHFLKIQFKIVAGSIQAIILLNGRMYLAQRAYDFAVTHYSAGFTWMIERFDISPGKGSVRDIELFQHVLNNAFGIVEIGNDLILIPSLGCAYP